MATLNLEILNAAYSDGLITEALSNRQKIYLHPSVITANALLVSLKGGEFNIEQISKENKLSENTALMYLRWLRSKDLVRIRHHEGLSKDARQLNNIYSLRLDNFMLKSS